MSAEVGSIANGTVIKIMPFGALVKLESGEVGLVHISEISSKFISDINECVKISDKVKVKVLEVTEDKKMSLSIKKAAEQVNAERRERKMKDNEPKKKAPVRPADIDWGRKSTSDLSFEDKLSKFKQDSDEAMLAIKRSNESKRSGGYKRGGY